MPKGTTTTAFKRAAFVLVCVGVFTGGIFALPIMASILGTYGGPTLEFWLLFGGGVAALGLPILLARELGYIKSHKTDAWVLDDQPCERTKPKTEGSTEAA